MYSEQMHRRTSIEGWLRVYHCDRSSAIANLPKLEAILLTSGSELESKDLEQFCRKSTKEVKRQANENRKYRRYL